MSRGQGSVGGYGEEVLVASANRNANGNSGILDGFGTIEKLRLQLDVTLGAGTTPTLDVVIEDTLDGNNWNVVGTFTQKTGVAREVINIHPVKAESATFQPIFADRLRVRWTIGGTAGPNFTFSVSAVSQSPAA